MVVHVCERAAKSGAAGVHVATDDERIADAVRAHGHRAIMTRADHPSGTDRLAEAASKLALQRRGDRRQRAGRRAADRAEADRAGRAHLCSKKRKASVSTACHAIHDAASLANPNVVKVVLDAEGYALYFSRSRIPYPARGGRARATATPASTATASAS